MKKSNLFVASLLAMTCFSLFYEFVFYQDFIVSLCYFEYSFYRVESDIIEHQKGLAGIEMSLLVNTVSTQSHHTNAGFRNPFPGFKETKITDFFKWKIFDSLKNGKPQKPKIYHFEIVENNGKYLRENKTDFTVTWIGHSTLLIQMDGMNILTDPIWSERCSPVPFAGPKRFVKPGLALEDLPDIDVVIISHDHYDHLDRTTVKKLGKKPLYLVPSAVSKRLQKWGLDNYKELDWWESLQHNGIEFACMPAQHFSGRTPGDRNRTLWCSWVFRGEKNNFYFAGDSGYFPGFKEIGQRYGPFDLAAIPIGSYMPRWFMRPIHLDPGEAVQALQDVKGKICIPIHWGTFDLADEPLDMPPKELLHNVDKLHLPRENFLILQHGETRVVAGNH